MAATADQTLWGFRYWLKRNPFKSIEAMNEDDFDAAFNAFVAVNVTQATLSTTDPGSYGDLDWPKKGTTTRWAADGAGVAAAQTDASCEQSSYPEQHMT